MACILNIETSTDVCSVAVSKDGACIWEREDHSGPNHAVQLGIYIDEALGFLDQHLEELDAVAVSSGPGSYTGLRIGVSMAKGICYGRSVPLISIPTLHVLSIPVLLNEALLKQADEAMEAGKTELFVPMLDARRMEVYASVMTRGLKDVRPVQADIVDGEIYKEWLDSGIVYFYGNGAAKCKEVINHPNAHFVDNIEPLARWMFPLAEKKFLKGEFEDVAYFVPFYLKEFQATLPKKLI